jgi:hypothetical protein
METENTNKWEFNGGDVSVIEVGSETGEIEINAVEGDIIKVEVMGEYDADKCEISTEIKDGKLSLSAKGKKRWFWKNSNCKAGFKVTAPTKKELIAKSGTGLIRVLDFLAGGEFKSGTGIIEFKNLSGPIIVKSGAGIIKGDIYSEDFESKSGAGVLDVSWNKAPQKGKVSIKSGAGSSNLSFPSETKMRVNFKSGAGSLHNEFGDDSKADFKIDYKSGAGSLNIKKV